MIKIKQHWWLWGILLLACVAYFLPWVWTPAAAMTPNAHDLAEWTTLHPSVRQSTPPLLPSFLLRAALGILAILFVLQNPPANSKWFGRVLALGLIVVMLPPADFFLSARGDINYRQQFYLSVITLLLSLGIVVGSAKFSVFVQKVLRLLFASLGLIVGLWGLALGMTTYSVFGISSAIGGGGILYSSLLFIFWTIATLDLIKQQKTRGK